MSGSGMSPLTTVGAVHLTVADLGRSLRFYRETVGLALTGESSDGAVLGIDGEGGARELVALHERPGAIPARGYSGLYHLALLVPQRRDLAAWLAHAARSRVPMTGFSDHFVSEALYLQDPDDHGIEIYRDRPRETWEGQIAARMTTLPLDVGSLMAELADPATEPFNGLPSGTRIGHVHLRVAQIPETVEFYRDLLGFDLVTELAGQAAFLSTGGYHHHVGANTWESAGAGPAPEDRATLHHATILMPGEAARTLVVDCLTEAGHTPEPTPDGPMVTDPSGNRLLLALA